MKQLFLFSLLLLVTACSTKPSQPLIDNSMRAQQIAKLDDWQFSGKIGFISPQKKQSANLFWLQQPEQQQIKLTTFLGINVLSIEGQDPHYQLTVDGENYQTDNLTDLVYQLTGLVLPTQALTRWLLAAPYHPNDQVIYNDVSALPSELISHNYATAWHVYYQQYQPVKNMMLPMQLTLVQQNIKVKIKINQWTLR